MTRYRVNTEEWQVFDRKKPSYWAFEKGVYLEQFDSIFHIEASIKADTAYYYDKERLWKLIGNVDIQNRKGERFNTELLYWNEATRRCILTSLYVFSSRTVLSPGMASTPTSK
ncbi:hypothetical protein BFINE_25880 [Bacteroides finegoldii DSM 17565]|nr:hypothetical protein BFINE_25880 [Bacteroides finegoldii DSM 17565]